MSGAPTQASTALNRRWVLARRPTADLVEGDLVFTQDARPVPGDGEALIRNVYLSIDPTHRIWMSDVEQYMTPVRVGAVMRGLTLGVVEQSRADGLKEGDIVSGLGDWQDYYVARLKAVTRIEPRQNLPLTAYLGPLGSPGATAYFGLFDIGRPRPAETVVVSAAAGAVGATVGQMAKLIGCHVIGIAGSEAKCRWIVEDLGFDAAVNYRKGDLLQALRRTCPRGIDVYFDNVGGETLDAALSLVNLRARIVVCGLISTYNQLEESSGPRMFRNVLMKRARIEGFIVSDYWSRFPEAFAAIGRWLETGQLKFRMDVRAGLEIAPEALKLLFSGENTGKLVVQVSEDTAPRRATIHAGESARS
jgi:NADPH-dependent curcumin reductase